MSCISDKNLINSLKTTMTWSIKKSETGVLTFTLEEMEYMYKISVE